MSHRFNSAAFLRGAREAIGVPAGVLAANYIAAHCVAMTSWAISMRRCPEMPAAERMTYLAGLSSTCIAVSTGAGAVGYLIAGSIPAMIQIGLVFLTPVYFFVFLNDADGFARDEPA